MRHGRLEKRIVGGQLPDLAIEVEPLRVGIECQRRAPGSTNLRGPGRARRKGGGQDVGKLGVLLVIGGRQKAERRVAGLRRIVGVARQMQHFRRQAVPRRFVQNGDDMAQRFALAGQRYLGHEAVIGTASIFAHRDLAHVALPFEKCHLQRMRLNICPENGRDRTHATLLLMSSGAEYTRSWVRLGIFERASPTLSRSICTCTTPGRSPPSATTSPQGLTTSEWP